jgi:predicted transcriptional regulator
MTRQIITITTETRLEEAMAVMTERRFRHLPVMEGDEIVGMVSSGDLMRWVTINQEEYIRQVQEYITGAAAVLDVSSRMRVGRKSLAGDYPTLSVADAYESASAC